MPKRFPSALIPEHRRQRPEAITQRHAAASQYEAAGHADRASRLRLEAEVIASAAGAPR